MREVDPGHRYELDHLDGDQPWATCETLQFVERIGGKFPGNEPPGCAGTTTQEVIRALIARQKYVDGQRPCSENTEVIVALRRALVWLEIRAANERGDKDTARVIPASDQPERLPVCPGCHHVGCNRRHEST